MEKIINFNKEKEDGRFKIKEFEDIEFYLNIILSDIKDIFRLKALENLETNINKIEKKKEEIEKLNEKIVDINFIKNISPEINKIKKNINENWEILLQNSYLLFGTFEDNQIIFENLMNQKNSGHSKKIILFRKEIEKLKEIINNINPVINTENIFTNIKEIKKYSDNILENKESIIIIKKLFLSIYNETTKLDKIFARI